MAGEICKYYDFINEIKEAEVKIISFDRSFKDVPNQLLYEQVNKRKEFSRVFPSTLDDFELIKRVKD